MQNEVFPEDTKRASRQVFTVNSVEIVDQLAKSNFRVFLKRHYSPEHPLQTYADMVKIAVTPIAYF